jgi:hypothetical protein
MVESKYSVLDSYETVNPPPLVHATVAPDENLLYATGTVVSAHNSSTSTTTTSEHEHVMANHNIAPVNKKKAAGIMAGITGCLVGGPILGVVFGLGVAHAYDKEGFAGDTARATGDIAALALQKARSIDEKHHVVDKSKVLANQAIARAQEIDQEHHVLEKATTFAVSTWQAFVDFCQRNRVAERFAKGFSFVMCAIAKKMGDRQQNQARESRR